MAHEDPVSAAPHEIDRDIASVAALGDPQRRAMYRYVVAQTAPVSRDQVAEGVGVARHTAKFHLDRLVADGLLDVEFARPPGRGGPGAGRPAKFFRRTARDVTVNLPARQYDLAGQLLARAVTDAQHHDIAIGDALVRAARDCGRTLATDSRRRAGPGASQPEDEAALLTVLTENGYEPRPDDDSIVLANCPFHALAQEHTDLVCGMNLHLIDGVIETLNARRLTAVLDPAPGRCCVRIQRVPTEPR